MTHRMSNWLTTYFLIETLNWVDKVYWPPQTGASKADVTSISPSSERANTDQLADYLTGWIFDWLLGWLTDRLIELLTGLQPDLLIDQPIAEWLANWPSKIKEKKHLLFCFFLFTEFEDAFSVYDVQGTGRIKLGAVFPLIRSLGYNPLEAKVWVFMNELDLTGGMYCNWSIQLYSDQTKRPSIFLSVCLVSRSLVSKYCHKTDPHGENDLPKADKCVWKL